MALITIKQFSKKYPWPSEDGLRTMIYRKRVEGAITRCGRRVLIDEDVFFDIVKKGNRSVKDEK